MVAETSDVGRNASEEDRQADDLHAADADDIPDGLSGGLARSLVLIFAGVSIGVFWREIFQLTVKLFERLAVG